MIILPLFQRLSLITLWVLLAHTGTIGTSALIAVLKAPVLNGNNPRPTLRVPSGKSQIDIFLSLIFFAVKVIVFNALLVFLRSIKILPVNQYI